MRGRCDYTRALKTPLSHAEKIVASVGQMQTRTWLLKLSGSLGAFELVARHTSGFPSGSGVVRVISASFLFFQGKAPRTSNGFEAVSDNGSVKLAPVASCGVFKGTSDRVALPRTTAAGVRFLESEGLTL